MPDKPKSGAAPLRKLRLTDWSRLFLAELAATSNVSAAARKAGVCTSTAYEARRQSAEFNRAWQQALCEGYDLLEMDLLRRLREGEVKPAAGAKRGVRTYDNAAALRLLAAHREVPRGADPRGIRCDRPVDQRQAGKNAPAPPGG
ncbi:MAG: hypothetical protein ACOY7T_13340 [Pseudomonadota bacterium]